MTPSWEGSIWDAAVVVRGVQGTLSVVVGQLRGMWDVNLHRDVILADQIWFTVNMET